jgi:hypothetical protein
LTLTALNLDDTLQQIINTIVDLFKMPVQVLQQIMQGWISAVNGWGVWGPLVAAFVIGVAIMIIWAFAKMRKFLPET